MSAEPIYGSLPTRINFGHAKIIEYCNRPFANIREHDEALVANWNNLIKGGDTVYHLGDFGWSADVLPKLAGKIMLIKGNHDNNKVTSQKRFGFVKDVHRIKKNGIGFFLSHYAHRSWPKMARGEIHLYGHSHGNIPDLGRSTDVGVDCWNYTPVHIDQIFERFKDVDPIADHRSER